MVHETMSSPMNGRRSPSGVDDDLEYFTVDNYEWPKYEAPKRARLEEEERKKRHREVQRQFMRRKRAREAVLKTQIRHLELQLQIVRASKEVKTLVQEGITLRTQLGPNIDTPLMVQEETEQDEEQEEGEAEEARDELDDPLLVEVLMSW